MCGIIGQIGNRPSEANYRLFGDLLYLSSARGTDATGIAILTDEEIKIVKEDIPADKFLEKYYDNLEEEVTKANIILGHARSATQGPQTDNNNNHPIIGEKYVMIHNGTCSSMPRIRDYKYKGTVDSEILLSYIETEGLQDGLKKLRGTAAVAIITADEPNTVYLWRHRQPLWLAYNVKKETIFFGSTQEILERGLSDILNFFTSFYIRELPENALYKITYNPLKIEYLKAVIPIDAWGGIYYPYGRQEDFLSYRDGFYEDGYDNLAKSRTIGDTPNTPLNSDTPKDSVSALGEKEICKDLIGCQWNSKSKTYTIDPILPSSDTSTRYYFNGQSSDFTHWRRLEGGGHVSIDKKLIKFFDREKKSHFIMRIADAIKEGLIDLSK